MYLAGLNPSLFISSKYMIWKYPCEIELLICDGPSVLVVPSARFFNVNSNNISSFMIQIYYSYPRMIM